MTLTQEAAAQYTPERRLVPRLIAPAPVHLERARWLLAREMGDAQDALRIAEAAERTCQKLLDRLAKVITPSGCQALLSRALRLARADFRFLSETEPGHTAGAYLEGLRKRAEGVDQGQVDRGLAALLGTLMELTALFIGEYLMGRMLLEVWPDLPVHEPSQSPGAGK